MSVAPGSILGFMAIRDALKSRNALTGSFLDSGCGEGWAAIQLLKLGFTEGTAVEPSKVAFDRAVARMEQLSEDRVTLLNCRIDQIETGGAGYDLGCSFTVIEHIENDVQYVRELASRVRSGGYVVVTVPARQEKWTLEDDLVGHLRRYSRETLEVVMREAGLSNQLQVFGMGWPLMNWTEPLRNLLLKYRHTSNEELSSTEQTELSGMWNIKWLNTFPRMLGLLVNERSLRPFHWAQKLGRNSRSCVMLVAIAQVG